MTLVPDVLGSSLRGRVIPWSASSRPSWRQFLPAREGDPPPFKRFRDWVEAPPCTEGGPITIGIFRQTKQIPPSAGGCSPANGESRRSDNELSLRGRVVRGCSARGSGCQWLLPTREGDPQKLTLAQQQAKNTPCMGG